jgi:hypothetical protein
MMLRDPMYCVDISAGATHALRGRAGMYALGLRAARTAQCNGPTSLKSIAPWQIIGLSTIIPIHRLSGWNADHGY